MATCKCHLITSTSGSRYYTKLEGLCTKTTRQVYDKFFRCWKKSDCLHKCSSCHSMGHFSIGKRRQTFHHTELLGEDQESLIGVQHSSINQEPRNGSSSRLFWKRLHMTYVRCRSWMGRIEEPMNIHQFINPFEEAIGDTNEDIVNDVVSRYAEQERLAETDEEVDVIPVITVSQAQEACRILRLHEEQQLKGDMDMLRQLRRHERWLFERRQNSQKGSHSKHLGSCWGQRGRTRGF